MKQCFKIQEFLSNPVFRLKKVSSDRRQTIKKNSSFHSICRVIWGSIKSANLLQFRLIKSKTNELWLQNDVISVTYSLSRVRHSTPSLEAITLAVLVSVVSSAWGESSLCRVCMLTCSHIVHIGLKTTYFRLYQGPVSNQASSVWVSLYTTHYNFRDQLSNRGSPKWREFVKWM